MYKQWNKWSNCSIRNTIACCLILIFWLLPYFANSITVKPNAVSFIKVKAHSSVSIKDAVKASAEIPDDPFQPQPLPEDSEFPTPDLEKNTDDDSKNAQVALVIHLLTIEELQSVQSVRSSHFTQAIQQRIAIPLFVLHHSWKRYLI